MNIQKIKILSVVFFNMISFHFAKTQTTDSTNCDKFYEWLDSEREIETEPITFWSRPPLPQPTETNRFIFCELCDMLTNEPKRIVITLLLDINGNPVCDRIHSEIIHDSLKNEIRKLLYKLKFNPALGGLEPVVSHYNIITPQHCEFYRDAKEFKKTFTIPPNRSEKRRNRLRRFVFW